MKKEKNKNKAMKSKHPSFHYHDTSASSSFTNPLQFNTVLKRQQVPMNPPSVSSPGSSSLSSPHSLSSYASSISSAISAPFIPSGSASSSPSSSPSSSSTKGNKAKTQTQTKTAATMQKASSTLSVIVSAAALASFFGAYLGTKGIDGIKQLLGGSSSSSGQSNQSNVWTTTFGPNTSNTPSTNQTQGNQTQGSQTQGNQTQGSQTQGNQTQSNQTEQQGIEQPPATIQTAESTASAPSPQGTVGTIGTIGTTGTTSRPPVVSQTQNGTAGTRRWFGRHHHNKNNAPNNGKNNNGTLMNVNNAKNQMTNEEKLSVLNQWSGVLSTYQDTYISFIGELQDTQKLYSQDSHMPSSILAKLNESLLFMSTSTNSDIAQLRNAIEAAKTNTSSCLVFEQINNALTRLRNDQCSSLSSISKIAIMQTNMELLQQKLDRFQQCIAQLEGQEDAFMLQLNNT